MKWLLAYRKASLEPRLSIPDFSPKLRDKIWNRKPGFRATEKQGECVTKSHTRLCTSLFLLWVPKGRGLGITSSQALPSPDGRAWNEASLRMWGIYTSCYIHTGSAWMQAVLGYLPRQLRNCHHGNWEKQGKYHKRSHLPFVLCTWVYSEPRFSVPDLILQLWGEICYSLVPRLPLFLPSICVHNNTRKRKTFFLFFLFLWTDGR